MAKKKPDSTPAIDLRSAEPVLYYTGGPVRGHVPARDLTAADLAYAHRCGALQASGGEWVPPATPEDVEALATLLSSTGSFARQAPAADDPPVAASEMDEPASEEPAAPADEKE